MDFKTSILRGSSQLGRAVGAAKIASKSRTARSAVEVARAAAMSGPVAEIARLCGRAGVAGAIVDGAMGGIQAVKAVNEGRIDAPQAAKHVAAEAGCGFVTSASGTAGTVAVYLITGSMGPAALALGMGASMGSRWAYRKVVGETLPEGDKVDTSKAREDTGDLEEIGPEAEEE